MWAKLKSEKLDEQVAEVVAIDGNVILKGKPSNAFMKMKAIEAALSVEGVTGVEDELDVASAESQEELVKEHRERSAQLCSLHRLRRRRIPDRRKKGSSS